MPIATTDGDMLRMMEPPLADQKQEEKKPEGELLPRPKTSRKPAPEAPPTWEGACGEVGPADSCPTTCSPDSCGDVSGICDGGICRPDNCPGDPWCYCQDNCIWFRTEYLLWRVRSGPAPPLVTTSPQTSGGVLGRPGTSILFGGPLDYEERSGGRFTIGYWFDQCRCFGLEGVFFFLGERTIKFDSASNGDPLLARPFFNTQTNAQDAELVANTAIPGMPRVIPLTGRISVRSSDELWGAEANGVFNICRDCCNSLDLLAGFRYIRLSEDLVINEHLLVPPTSPTFAGATFDLLDSFQTRNQFYGGQIGVRRDWRWRRWDLEFMTKVALGDMHQVVDIGGATIITPPGGPSSTFNGGLLTQPTNIGHFSRDRFAVVPEVGVTIGYQITQHMRFYAGYNFLYLSDVVRPGQQVDFAVNPTQLPTGTTPGTLVGARRPAFVFRESDFWAQGFVLGLEFKF
jgi:hypothetical protein